MMLCIHEAQPFNPVTKVIVRNPVSHFIFLYLMFIAKSAHDFNLIQLDCDVCIQTKFSDWAKHFVVLCLQTI